MRTALCTLLLAALATPAGAAPLQVDLVRLRNVEGTVKLRVVGSVEAYEGKAEAAARETWRPDAKAHRFEFDLPPGLYAVQVIHDANDNGKLDVNGVGMPTESYGTSNNPQVWRKPTFEEARFELGAEGTTISIEMQ